MIDILLHRIIETCMNKDVIASFIITNDLPIISKMSLYILIENSIWNDAVDKWTENTYNNTRGLKTPISGFNSILIMLWVISLSFSGKLLRISYM